MTVYDDDEVEVKLPTVGELREMGAFPACLDKPLVWGDTEQVAALRKLEKLIGGEEGLVEIRGYTFVQEAMHSREVYIEAASEEEARELLSDGHDGDSSTWELEEVQCTSLISTSEPLHREVRV